MPIDNQRVIEASRISVTQTVFITLVTIRRLRNRKPKDNMI